VITGAALTNHPEPTRNDALRNELLVTVDALKNRRADLISEALVAEYVALYWLEWNGGSLQLTETGKNVVQQMRAAARTPAP
jgi:predicted RNase H-like nuclease